MGQDLEQLKKKLADLEETLKDSEAPTGAAGQPVAEKDEDKRSIFVSNVRLVSVNNHFFTCEGSFSN